MHLSLSAKAGKEGTKVWDVQEIRIEVLFFSWERMSWEQLEVTDNFITSVETSLLKRRTIQKIPRGA